MRNIQAMCHQRANEFDGVGDSSSLVRVLVVDDDNEIAGQIENALWVWPHKITVISSAEDAVRLCRHITPSVILVALDGSNSNAARMIPALRRRLPTIPLVGLVSPRQYREPGKFFDQGADALLLRDDASRPTLHDFLMNVRRNFDSVSPLPGGNGPELTMPWRNSQMMGALICDISGSITDANRALATWLGYSSVVELSGRKVPQNVLSNVDDWSNWVQVAADTDAILRQETSITTRDGQYLWVELEVFAAPRHPSHLQAVFTDRTLMTLPIGQGYSGGDSG